MVPHQFYQLDSWLRMLRANASERGRSANLKDVPAVFLIHCYNEGISPSISALEAYARKSPAAPVMMPTPKVFQHAAKLYAHVRDEDAAREARRVTM
jgi:hypothetical protein